MNVKNKNLDKILQIIYITKSTKEVLVLRKSSLKNYKWLRHLQQLLCESLDLN